MTIWIHGNTAGAHALAWKFAESRLCSKIICTPGNAGTQTLCEAAPASAYAVSLEIPQTQLLYHAASPFPEGSYTDICAFSDGKKHHFSAPVHIQADGAQLSCEHNPDTRAAQTGRYRVLLSDYMQYCEDSGIYTFRFSDKQPYPLHIFKGLPDATACAILPCLQFDLVRIFQMMTAGFPETFELKLRQGGVAVLRVDGQTGAKLENLAALPGDIGVFLHQMENTGNTLRFTGPHGLYLCAREKTTLLAQEKVMAASRLLQILPPGCCL